MEPAQNLMAPVPTHPALVGLGDAYVEVVVPVEEGPVQGLFYEFEFVTGRTGSGWNSTRRVGGLQTYGTAPYLAT